MLKQVISMLTGIWITPRTVPGPLKQRNATYVEHISELPLLPEELWHEVFAFLQVISLPNVAGFDTLLDVSRVCRALYLLTLPLRFGSISFEPFQDKCKIQQLIVRPALRSWVKRLVFYGNAGQYKDIFQGMVNLVDLKFTNIKITRQLCTHLFHLPRLQRLEISGVRFADDVVITDQDVAMLGIEFLSINWCYGDSAGGRPGCLSRPLASLVFAPQLQEIKMENIMKPIPFKKLMLQHRSIPLWNLRCLTVWAPQTAEQFNTLFNFLHSSPNLRRLTVQTDGIVCSAHLSEEAIPHLQEFDGAIDLAGVVVRGRPVGVVKLTLGNDDDLRPLSLGTASVRELRLRWTSEWQSDHLRSIANFCPQLETLELEYRVRDFSLDHFERWIVAYFAQDVAGFSQLRTLVLDAHPRSRNVSETLEEEEHTALNALPEDHPLGRVKLHWGREWRREGGSWRQVKIFG